MKEKRKTRLTKESGKGEFIGFGAFAGTTTLLGATNNSTDLSATNNHQQEPAALAKSLSKRDKNLSGGGSGGGVKWSPIYQGSNVHLASVLFPRILKRDAVTKIKALQELIEYFNSTTDNKKEQVLVWCHYSYLFHNSLYYNSNTTVRSLAIGCCLSIQAKIPKAFQTICKQQPEILGMIFCSQCDPAYEVRQQSPLAISDDEKDPSLQETLKEGVWMYGYRILSYGRAKTMHDQLFARKMIKNQDNVATTADPSSSKLGGKKNKNKNKNSQNSGGASELSEAQRDQLEEKFERIVATALGGIHLWIQQYVTEAKEQQQDVLIIPPNCGVPIKSSGPGHQKQDISFLWKHTMSSPKSSLRRNTYQMIKILCHTKAMQSWIVPQNASLLTKLLIQSFNSEKDPTNIPILIETLITFLILANSQTKPTDSSKQDCHNFVKPLSKLFSKACYGSSATVWGPMVLPLINLFENSNIDSKKDDNQLVLISSVWNGQANAVSNQDRVAIANAVAETSAYLLLSPSTPAENNEVDAQKLSHLWLQVLSFYLLQQKQKSTTRSSSISSLVNNLANHLVAFENKHKNCTDDQELCLYNHVRSKFWTVSNDEQSQPEGDNIRCEQLSSTILDNRVNLVQLSQLLQSILSTSKNVANTSLLEPILCSKFWDVVSQYQKSSGSVPMIADDYVWFLSCLQYCNNDAFRVMKNINTNIDNNNNDAVLHKFIMNDILRWIILHTSKLSVVYQKDMKHKSTYLRQLVQYDFQLLKLLFLSMNQKNTTNRESSNKIENYWPPLLQEIIKAQCDLELLSAGLRVLVSSTNLNTMAGTAVLHQALASSHEFCIAMNEIQCDVLDHYAIEVVQDYSNKRNRKHHAHIDDDEQKVEETLTNAMEMENDYDAEGCYREMKYFLQTCLGYDDGCGRFENGRGTKISSSSLLVERAVVTSWIEIACTSPPSLLLESLNHDDESDYVYKTNPVLEVLLMIMLQDQERIKEGKETNALSLTETEISLVTLESWKHESSTKHNHTHAELSLWEEFTLPLLLHHNDSHDMKNICAAFIQQASTDLKQKLTDYIIRKENLDDSFVDRCYSVQFSDSWSLQAFRLLELSKKCQEKSETEKETDSGMLSPSLSLVGLADDKLLNFIQEESRTNNNTVGKNTFFQCLMCLFAKISDSNKRLQFLLACEGKQEQQQENSTTLPTTIKILLALSEATTTVGATTIRSEFVKQRQDYCAQFLNSIVVRSCDNNKNLLENWCHLCLSCIKKAQNDDMLLVPQCIAVLSQLLDLLFVRRIPNEIKSMIENENNDDEYADATEIDENSKVWYIVNTENPNKRIYVTVAKVHYDAQAGYYFTIRLPAEDNAINSIAQPAQERQTILGRLRKRDYRPGGTCSIDKANHDNSALVAPPRSEILKREQVAKAILDIVKPMISVTVVVNDKRVVESSTSGPSGNMMIFISELIYTVISQCGLGSERGVGTLHYEVIQLLSSVESKLQQLLLHNSTNDAIVADNEEMRTLLWCLAQIYGFGLNTPSASSTNNWYLRWLNINPKVTCSLLLEYMENIASKTTFSKEKRRLDEAVLAFFVSAIGSLKDHVNCEDQNESSVEYEAVVAMHKLATENLKRNLERGDNDMELGYASTLSSLKAISVALTIAVLRSFTNPNTDNSDDSDNEYEGESLDDLELHALSAVVESFCGWECGKEDEIALHNIFALQQPDNATSLGNSGNHSNHNMNGPFWKASPYFATIIDISISSRQSIISVACEQYANQLIDCLYNPSKRWYAFRLLVDGVAFQKKLKMQKVDEDDEDDEDDVIASPNDATQSKMKQWTNDLDEDEKLELEEDICLVCDWLPHRLMNELESWADDDEHDNDDESMLVGRMLSWLCTLHLMDLATPQDPMYRPAFCSYINKCKSVGSILNQALLHTGICSISNNNNSDDFIYSVEQLLKQEAVLDDDINHYTQLGALVLFRTIECLPTLSKWWHEEECPKVYMQPIRELVEKKVAPKILQTELEQINRISKNNSTTGDGNEMIVTGSIISREVTATYVQDDFKLTVLVKLPQCFPFRSAEVDCSKTLGVPEKRWKRWALQITLMLNNQGGTLQDALQLWKENVDKEFDGVEPCPVCYSVLHVKCHKLPEMECKVCHNRFHTDCLAQWFRSSGKSQCVLCQQPWSGIKVQ